ncbi:hypothetical protein K2173_009111 [Erythroxylum novogranatense]|uniref:non-specific serine/threonine protein kinase n=1 Tax=Erythroxylum novogranatense TaxID=1862640 RepID=A0AAV8TD26_9ROSI|nr:hypothetical protein K2173_009111 [Erythroxylum novogranatense]
MSAKVSGFIYDPRQPFLYFGEFFFLILFAHQLPTLHAISFKYPDFTNTQNLTLISDASSFGGVISLTRNRADAKSGNSSGRAVYSEEIHLWDRSNGKVANFTTHFTFNISTLPGLYGGDGIAFFLAPNGSHIPENSEGGCLALISCYDLNTTKNPNMVAVEFDTFKNNWDPDSSHLGINVNSMVSATNITRSTNMKNGSLANAWVTYNSQTRNLSVFLTYADNPVFSGNSSLSYRVDLSKVLPEWVTVGFSSSTGAQSEVHYILSWEFNSTEISSNPNPDSGSGTKVGLIVGCIVGGLFLVVGSIALLLFYRRRHERERDYSSSDDSMDQEFEKGTGPRRFSYGELVQATNNFSEESKLGEGGFGAVYGGYLSDANQRVAVKRVSKGSKQAKKEYISEVKIISRLRHRNLVQLVGWCHEKGEFLLVYEFMPKGSLDSHLFGIDETGLSWALRYKIATGLASALLYLHDEWEQCVVHRDIKSSNVMLDSGFNTKLGDFGLARLMDHELGLKTTGLAGTFGYMAPEYIATGKASKASDVYSFGVVALEIACGRRTMEARNEEGQISLVAWVWRCYGSGRLLDVADGRLNMDFDVAQMESLLLVGLWCAHPDHKFRPSISQALQVLNFEAPLPSLPPQMPVPRYDGPTSSTSSSEPLLSVIEAR